MLQDLDRLPQWARHQFLVHCNAQGFDQVIIDTLDYTAGSETCSFLIRGKREGVESYSSLFAQAPTKPNWSYAALPLDAMLLAVPASVRDDVKRFCDGHNLTHVVVTRIAEQGGTDRISPIYEIAMGARYPMPEGASALARIVLRHNMTSIYDHTFDIYNHTMQPPR